MNKWDSRAYDELFSLAEFSTGQAILELGAGTGTFALRVLSRVPVDLYVIVERDQRVASIARTRTLGHTSCVDLIVGPDPLPLPFVDCRFDRVISCYVLDGMEAHRVSAYINEAHRLLKEGGLLCTLVTCRGETPLGSIAMSFWDAIHMIDPKLVGMSHTMSMVPFLELRMWRGIVRRYVETSGLASEVTIARKVAFGSLMGDKGLSTRVATSVSQ